MSNMDSNPAVVSLVTLALLVSIALCVWAVRRPAESGAEPRREPSPAPRPAERAPARRAAPPSRRPPDEAEGTGTAKADAFWIQPGRTVEVAGVRIRGGLIYVGSGLSRVSLYGVEPALIDPNLRVSRSWSSLDPDEIPHLASYRDLSPAARGAYLQWLAEGRMALRAPTGLVLLYFAGLERRLLADIGLKSPAHPEVAPLIREVERLLSFYGKARLFRYYADNLLEFVRLARTGAKLYDEDPPQAERRSEIPALLRLGLAQAAADRVPLSFAWALAWVETDPEYTPRTAATRCRNEFVRLFAHAYTERFGAGCELSPGADPLRFFYRPASRSFQQELELAPPGLTDVTAGEGPIGELRALSDECANRLAAYSRFVERRPKETASFRALALLSPELIRPRRTQELSELSERLLEITGGASIAIIDLDEIFNHLPDARPSPLERRDGALLAQFLEHLEIGIEPDARFRAFIRDYVGKAVVFRLPDRNALQLSCRFLAASVMLHLSAIVSNPTNPASVRQKRNLVEHLENAVRLEPAERLRLRATLEWILLACSRFTGRLSRLQHLDFAERRKIGQLIEQIAGFDASIAASDLEELNSIYGMLRLEKTDVPGTLGVTLRPKSLAVELPQPEPGDREEEKRRAHNETSRIESELKEAHEVAAIVEELMNRDGSRPPPGAARIPGTLEGLDEAYSLPLFKLLKKPVWSRQDLEIQTELAGPQADEMIEAINDAALQEYAAPLLIGEDPVEVAPELARRLLS